MIIEQIFENFSERYYFLDLSTYDHIEVAPCVDGGLKTDEVSMGSGGDRIFKAYFTPRQAHRILQRWCEDRGNSVLRFHEDGGEECYGVSQYGEKHLPTWRKEWE